MIRRRKAPNKGRWSPPGGKLDMVSGESPFECAAREAREETGLLLEDDDLSMFGYVSEKGYESTTNWLMFLFDCKKVLSSLPPISTKVILLLFSTGNRQLGNSANRPRVGLAVVRQAKGGFWGASRVSFEPTHEIKD